MSRSYRGRKGEGIIWHACNPSAKSVRWWKQHCSHLRRHRCNMILKGTDIEDIDDKFFPNKCNHDMKDTTSWESPYDGWWWKDIKSILEYKRYWQYLDK